MTDFKRMCDKSLQLYLFLYQKTLKNVDISMVSSPAIILAVLPKICKNPCIFEHNNAITTIQQNQDKSLETVGIPAFQGINITDVRCSYARLCGRGIRIRTLNDGVRVRSVTVTLYLCVFARDNITHIDLIIK